MSETTKDRDVFFNGKVIYKMFGKKEDSLHFEFVSYSY